MTNGRATGEADASVAAAGVFFPATDFVDFGGRKLDPRSDLFALGLTLYEMIAFRPPFIGKNPQDTLSQIIDRDPVEPRKFTHHAPGRYGC